MAEQADAPERDDEELEEVVDQEAETPEGDDTEEGSEGDDDQDPPDGNEPEDEIEISFGDEAAPASKGEDSGLVQKLRAEIRERDRQLAGFTKAAQPQKIEIGEKPTLESCDYDEEAFETALDAWKERKAQADRVGDDARKEQERTQAAWAEELGEYGRKKIALKVPDFDASEDAVTSTLSEVQQAIVIKAADDAAKIVYALGRHPEKLTTLAAIQDPIKFAAAVVKLEGTLKMTTRRKAPEPEGVARGSAPLRTGEDKVLARLEAEADRTGDRTKVMQHKRALRDKAKK